jgi:hypothetical protein
MTQDNANNLNEDILDTEDTEDEDILDTEDTEDEDILEGLLNTLNTDGDEDESGDVVLNANLISTVKVYSNSLPKGITVAEAYYKYAEKLGIDSSRIVGYKTNNKVILGNTKVEPNTSYEIVIQNQHKG